MKTVALIYLLASTTTLLSAQDKDSLAIRTFYNKNAILVTGNLNYYFQDDKRYPMKQMREVLKFSPEALHEFNEYQKDRSTTVFFLVTSVSCLVSSVFVKDRETRLALGVGAVLTAGIAIPFSKGWTTHLNRAVWVHNRDMLIR